MGLQNYLDLVEAELEIATARKISDNAYFLEQNGRIFKLYQQGKQVILEGAIGSPLKDTPETNAMLSELLQFNLKRTQFLDNTVFLDSDTHQLFLREVLTREGASEEEIKAGLEDFVLNIEVIEDRFFPKPTTN